MERCDDIEHKIIKSFNCVNTSDGIIIKFNGLKIYVECDDISVTFFNDIKPIGTFNFNLMKSLIFDSSDPRYVEFMNTIEKLL